MALDFRRARRRRDDRRGGRAARRQIRALRRWRQLAAPAVANHANRPRRSPRACPASSSPRAASPHSVMHGVHGRRRAGPGETFWQFRPFVSGEPASRVDWRRSAREDHAFVREREWEAAQTLWLWFDRSAVDALRAPDWRRAKSSTARSCWRSRSPILRCAAASASACIGLSRPIAARGVIDRFAEILAPPERDRARLRRCRRRPRSRRDAKVVLIGDFLSPATRSRRALRRRSARTAPRAI